MAKRTKKTKDDLLRMNTPTIPGTWAAEVIKMAPTRLIGYAREKPHLVSFPFQLSGNRMKIPRVPFLKWLGCTEEEIANKKLR